MHRSIRYSKCSNQEERCVLVSKQGLVKAGRASQSGLAVSELPDPEVRTGRP